MEKSEIKRCVYCNKKLEKPNINKGSLQNIHCEKCEDLYWIEDVIKEYWDKYSQIRETDHIQEKNFIYESEIMPGVKLFKLDKFSKTYDIKERTKNIKSIIDTITKARDYLFSYISPNIEVLKSFYEDKNIFWNELCGFGGLILENTIESCIIKLNEYFNDYSKLSIKTILNRIENDKNNIYKKQKVSEVREYWKSKNIQINTFPIFPYEEYKTRVLNLLESNKKIFDSFKDVRDNEFAHAGKIVNDENRKDITYENLRKIFSSVRVILEGLYFSICPEKISTFGGINHNLGLDHLENIIKFYRENLAQKKL